MMEHENGSFYVCGSSRNVPEDIYNAMKEVKDHPNIDPFRLYF
jgi:sulfite reductase alpha subunit-like flavoprotein